MEGWIFQTGLHEIGPWGLLVAFGVFIVIGIARGWLVPKTLHDQMLASAEARAVAAEAAISRLNERASKLTETNSVQARTIETQAAVGDTVTKLVDAIQRTSVAGGSK